MSSSSLKSLVVAIACALLAVVLTVGTAVVAIETGLVDESPSIERAIPALGSVMGVVAFLWRRDKDRGHE